ncbi:translation initiation factor IF-2-like [Falco peregrinus]|uniref:translation initiation factor IF-2-like n=1 Tax=Falco peregrinus TaxID=8954 RepID=UPI00247836A6|nr:translation initiation factor IF-2-like [Falco peregrinus]
MSVFGCSRLHRGSGARAGCRQRLLTCSPSSEHPQSPLVQAHFMSQLRINQRTLLLLFFLPHLAEGPLDGGKYLLTAAFPGRVPKPPGLRRSSPPAPASPWPGAAGARRCRSRSIASGVSLGTGRMTALKHSCADVWKPAWVTLSSHGSLCQGSGELWGNTPSTLPLGVMLSPPVSVSPSMSILQGAVPFGGQLQGQYPSLQHHSLWDPGRDEPMLLPRMLWCKKDQGLGLTGCICPSPAWRKCPFAPRSPCSGIRRPDPAPGALTHPGAWSRDLRALLEEGLGAGCSDPAQAAAAPGHSRTPRHCGLHGGGGGGAGPTVCLHRLERQPRWGRGGCAVWRAWPASKQRGCFSGRRQGGGRCARLRGHGEGAKPPSPAPGRGGGGR